MKDGKNGVLRIFSPFFTPGFAAALLAGILMVPLPGCGRKENIYSVRGVVVVADAAAGRLLLMQEPLPGFRDEAGKAAGLQAMTAGYGLAPGVSLKNIQVSDKLEIRFRVAWKQNPRFILEHYKKLAADTKLHFSAAAPAGGKP